MMESNEHFETALALIVGLAWFTWAHFQGKNHGFMYGMNFKKVYRAQNPDQFNVLVTTNTLGFIIFTVWAVILLMSV